MAKSNNVGFFLRKSLIGQEAPTTVDAIIAGSATLIVGQLVRINNAGLVVPAATGEVFAGVLAGIVDKNGINAFSGRGTGLSGATLTGDDTVVTASDNASNAAKNLKAQVYFDPAGQLLFYNQADTALAQTNLLQFFDVASGTQVTTGSASDSNGQVQLVQLDPDNDGTTTKGLFRMNETVFNAGVDTGTAKITA